MPRNRHKIYKPPQSSKSLEVIAKDIADKTPDSVIHSNYDGGSRHEQKTELRIRTQAIAIGFPMDELMFSQFFTNFLGLDYMPWDNIITTTSTYLPSARNEVHNVFLGTHATHLLMLDSDVLPPPRLIEKLMLHNKDMVGGWYRKKEKYGVKNLDGQVQVIQRPVVYDYLKSEGGNNLYVQRVSTGKGLEKVDAAGAGCWLMSRKVAEALGKSPYDMNSGGEDMVICKKITDLGFDLWVDWDIPCAHAGVFFV